MKKLLAYILVLVFILALVGCNDTQNNQNETSQNTTSQTATDTTTPNDKPEETSTEESSSEETTPGETSTEESSTKEDTLTEPAPEVTTSEPEQSDSPADIAQILIDYETTLKDDLNALREKYPQRTYFYHAVDRIECVYILDSKASADAIVKKHNMEDEFATAKVSALNAIKMISIVFERNDFTEAMHQKLKEIKEKESYIINFFVDMQRDIAESYQANIEYYTNHAVPLKYVAVSDIYSGKDVIIKSKVEYDAYLDNFLKEAKYDYLIEIITKQKELYDETFFEENALIVTRVLALSSGSITVTVENLYISDSKVYVVLKTEIPSFGTDDEQMTSFTIQVSQSEVADVVEVITVS